MAAAQPSRALRGGILLALALLGGAVKGRKRRARHDLAVCNSLSRERFTHGSCPNRTNSTPRVLRILITGVGGSGTRYVSHAFSLNGIDVRHEKLGADGAVSWKYAVDPLLLPVQWYEDFMPVRPAFSVMFAHVIHLVRCPTDVVSAMANWPPYVFEYMGAHVRLGRLPGYSWEDSRSNLVLYAEAWLRWNRHVEHYASARFRIDQIRELYKHVCTRLNRCVQPVKVSPHKIGHGRFLTFSWKDLRAADRALAHEVWKMSVEYGFSRECTED